MLISFNLTLRFGANIWTIALPRGGSQKNMLRFFQRLEFENLSLVSYIVMSFRKIVVQTVVYSDEKINVDVDDVKAVSTLGDDDDQKNIP